MIMVAEIEANKVGLEVAEEAMDPAFDYSSWNVDGWKMALQNLGGDPEDEQVLTLEAGASGVKEPMVAAEGDAGGEARGDGAAAGCAA
ncbi:hypothetical protein Hanom_Chr07g00623151 [Helianthus anomalus]